jgi:hypothetical protein
MPLTALLSAHKGRDRRANRPDDDCQHANNDNCAVAAAIAAPLLAALRAKPIFDRSICRCGCHVGDADPRPQNRRTPQAFFGNLVLPGMQIGNVRDNAAFERDALTPLFA